MTAQQYKRLIELAHRLRRVATPKGAQHAFWDVIFDIEAFVNGRLTILEKTADEWIEFAEQCLRPKPK